MSNLKLSLSIGELSLQLEGDGELVQTMLNELRENGLGELSKIPEVHFSTSSYQSNMIIPNNKELCNNTVDNNYPSLKEVALKCLPKSESEWILLYAFYASDFGTRSVSRTEIKEMYNVTNRMTTSRSNNFFNSLTSVVSNNYLSALNDDEYAVRPEGQIKINEILSRENSSENKTKTKRGSKVKQFQLIKDLDLSTTTSRKGLKDFVSEVKPTSNINITTTIIYYLQQIYEYTGDINGDIIFTCWRELGTKIPNDLAGNLRDVCSSRYGYANVENGNYSITIRGINLIEHTILEGQNK